VLSLQIIHLPELGTRARLNRGAEACRKINFTHVFLFLMYDVYVTTISSLIKSSYCVLKGFTTLP
jgi:adenosine/AMP kinase